MLKFWKTQSGATSGNSEFEVDAIVYDPHAGEVGELLAVDAAGGAGGKACFVTVGRDDGRVKQWMLAPVVHANRALEVAKKGLHTTGSGGAQKHAQGDEKNSTFGQDVCWQTVAVGGWLDSPAGAAAVAPDGSLLAVHYAAAGGEGLGGAALFDMQDGLSLVASAHLPDIATSVKNKKKKDSVQALFCGVVDARLCLLAVSTRGVACVDLSESGGTSVVALRGTGRVRSAALSHFRGELALHTSDGAVHVARPHFKEAKEKSNSDALLKLEQVAVSKGCAEGSAFGSLLWGSERDGRELLLLSSGLSVLRVRGGKLALVDTDQCGAAAARRSEQTDSGAAGDAPHGGLSGLRSKLKLDLAESSGDPGAEAGQGQSGFSFLRDVVMRGPLRRELAADTPGSGAHGVALRRELCAWRAPTHLVGSAQAVLRGVWRAVLPSSYKHTHEAADDLSDDEAEDEAKQSTRAPRSGRDYGQNVSVTVEEDAPVALDVESILAVKAVISKRQENEKGM